MSVRRALSGLLVSCLVAGTLSAQDDLPTRRNVVSSAVLGYGLVFEDGKFVPGPYVLETAETEHAVEVIVAGVRLDRFSVHVAIDVGPADPASPPPEYETPEGVDTLRGSGYPTYLQRLLEHHAALVGYEQALAVVEAEASNCPLVQRLERDAGGLLLFDRMGDPYFVGAEGDLVSPGLTRDEALVLADRTFQAYRMILSRGGAILHFHDADIFLPRARVVDLLVPSLEILDDPTMAPEDQRSRLKELWKNDGIVGDLMTGHRHVPELWGALQVYETEGR